ncbi:hypothetical protein YC2023_067307 [Brassica napus]
MQTAVPFRQVNVNIEKTTNEVTKRIAHLLYGNSHTQISRPQGGCSVQGRKLKSHLAASTVLLLTTVKPKIIGGERTLLYSPG